MIELTKETMAILSPIIAWASWATRSIYRNQHDIDIIFFVMRGNKGKRDRSARGRAKRFIYSMRGMTNAKHSN